MPLAASIKAVIDAYQKNRLLGAAYINVMPDNRVHFISLWTTVRKNGLYGWYLNGTSNSADFL